MGGIHLFIGVVPAQRESLLHWSKRWVAASESRQLDYALGVGSLPKVSLCQTSIPR